ncbi:MAG: hypothetical protein AVDCRST_MAG18-3307 [uncultured Thermomicrobiales bacterium]|uniref:Uncharacterized protein n=1 Tax=uncultured Thermomicrobiales bacterium TaxID=1645740 RepID=A0A6J4VSW0_9BACT|nr:MAG: hypothetical protein AVDCRST_MAG18-3307 [uncultured Thermomicrobiales bacterium]
MTYELKRDILRAMDVRVTLWPADHAPRYAIEASVPLGDEDGGAGCIVTSSTRSSTPSRSAPR